MKKITESKFYNAGFLNDTSMLRAKQNLQSQAIANACEYGVHNCVMRGYCSSDLLYPVRLPQPYPDMKVIPNHCPCVRYIQAP